MVILFLLIGELVFGKMRSNDWITNIRPIQSSAIILSKLKFLRVKIRENSIQYSTRMGFFEITLFPSPRTGKIIYKDHAHFLQMEDALDMNE